MPANGSSADAKPAKKKRATRKKAAESASSSAAAGSKTLVIAEKPSVAQDIARAMKIRKQGDVYENDTTVVTAAAGHLVELFMPEDIDKKRYGFWRLQELPILPERFQLKPVADKRSKDRLDALKKQLKRKDVGLVLNACDAGREGELIFTYIYEWSGCKAPYRRLWMQSMTPAAIRKAFDSLREPEQMQGLQDAARSRSEADWLVGINGTRAITKRMFGRAKQVATVGRVQTPTLSIVLQRELDIRAFKPRTFWRIHGTFSIHTGTYEGILRKAEALDPEDAHDRRDRLWDGDTAKALVEALAAPRFATVEEEKKRSRQSCPLLYDLTSLQREANGRFGLSANRTLQIAQALYEKHKVITYPRTDSRALPEDYAPTVRETLGRLEGDVAPFAQRALEQDWVKQNPRIFNNAKISDHFAIIPTGESTAKLQDIEEKLFLMIAQRFVGIFFPPAEFDETLRLTHLDAHTFESKGKVLVHPGWMEVYGRAQLDRQLPALGDEDRAPGWAQGLSGLPSGEPHLAQPQGIELEEDQTRPPARYTEATLLSAMEGAGKLVDDEELAAAMREKGLGTPATRASTIEHLIRERYLEREGRELLPTVKAENLFEFLSAVHVEALTRPDLTGEWEHKLHEVERGRLTRDQFMGGIIDLTKAIVERTKNFEEDEASARETSIVSPTDKKPMLETLRAFKSQDGELSVYKTVSGRKLSEEEVQVLVNERKVGPLDGFRSKAGKPFSGLLRLDPMNKVGFDFGDGDSGEGGEGQDLDRSELEVVGVFKATGSKVYAAPNAYACERSLDGEKEKAFRLSRTLLGKTLPPEEVTRMLGEGKTGLIKGFRSKRTGRLFDAHLLLKDDGGIGFEFPPRPPKKKTARKSAAS